MVRVLFVIATRFISRRNHIRALAAGGIYLPARGRRSFRALPSALPSRTVADFCPEKDFSTDFVVEDGNKFFVWFAFVLVYFRLIHVQNRNLKATFDDFSLSGT